MENNDIGLGKLIALKVVCCGGLLLALGGVSLGSITALLGNGWVQAGGIALIAAGIARYLWGRKWARQCNINRDESAIHAPAE